MGTRRFDDFQKQLGITRHLLSDRLTEAGLALYPVILVLTQWGNTWLDENGKHPPLELMHKPCGHKTDSQLRCSEFGEALHTKDMIPVMDAAPPRSGTI